MEPTLPKPHTPENRGVSAERSASLQGGAVEAPSGLSGEHVQQPMTTTPKLQPQPQQPMQSVAIPTTNTPSLSSTSSDDPIIADDVDVIEKEWVDKAKRIVSATKEDPHQQEQQVSKLQADYLMKRYNKKVKLP